MKVCIYGAGAVGGYLGAALSAVEDVEVSLIARGAHLQAIRDKGLTLRKTTANGTVEETTVRCLATDDPSELVPQDFLIVALKAHQAWDAAERMTPLLGPDTAVVTCQNGVPWWYFHSLDPKYDRTTLSSVDPGARQWNLLGPRRAIGCVVYPATEIEEPGVIKHVYGDKFAIGEPDGADSARCARLSRAMEAGGLRAPVLANIRDEIWLKLWGNLCFNPISALTRATLDVVATDPGTRATARAMMTEAETLARKLGADFRVDIERRIDGAAKVGAHRTSMLQDVDKGRALEIDALVTAVQEMGKVAEVATPTIDIVLGLVRQLGRSLDLYPTFPEPTECGAEIAAA